MADKKKKLQSANFKRDYVATLAILFFFLIIFAELFTAVAIPLSINFTTLYANEEKRQILVSEFDKARILCRTKLKNKQAKEELTLILQDLDLKANYLRTNYAVMPMEEVEEFTLIIQKYRTFIDEIIAEDDPFTSEINLDFSDAVRKLNRMVDKAPKFKEK